MSSFYRFFILFFPFFSLPLSAQQLKLAVSADSAILINADTGAILFSKRADISVYPASITKVATALYILDRYGHRLEEIATVSAEAVASCSPHLKKTNPSKYPAYYLEPGATHMHLRVGETMSLRVLFYGLMLVSANDAANVLAEHLCGSILKFMEELNSYLRAKGFKDTYFLNPHGLHHVEHKTTAQDMAGIAKEAMKFSFFREVVCSEQLLRPMTNKQPAMELLQHNRLLKSGRHYYPYATGIKTGRTAAAGFTLVASAKSEERSLVAVLLGCKESDHRYRDAVALFETAFSEKKVSRTLLTRSYDMFTCSVEHASMPIEAQMARDLSISYYPSEEPIVSSLIDWSLPPLPIKKGQFVGELRLFDEQRHFLKSEPIYSTKDIELTIWGSVLSVAKKVVCARLLFPLVVAIGLGCLAVWIATAKRAMP